MIKRLVFWEPSVSPHKAPLFRAIRQLRPDIALLHIAQNGVAVERQKMGWTSPVPEGYDEIVDPSQEDCKNAVEDRPCESLHVFSGIRHVPCIVKGLQLVRSAGARFAIMSEPRVNEGLRGMLRYSQSWLTERFLRHHSVCIFAIGGNGPRWFISVGYPREKVFPFAYFVNPPLVDCLVSNRTDSTLRIGYLGRLVRAKGIFELLKAFAMFRKDEAMLSIAGPFGKEASDVRLAANSCDSSVQLRGPIPMTDVSDFLGELDVFVLPSISKDGWGVVVSEALMMGIPVVATSCVGASIVLSDSVLGAKVKPNDSAALAAAIRSVTSTHNLSGSTRAWRRDWANAHLSAEAGARYFWAVVDHCLDGQQRPVPFYE